MDWSQVEKNEDILNEKVYVLYLGKKTSSATWVNVLAAWVHLNWRFHWLRPLLFSPHIPGKVWHI